MPQPTTNGKKMKELIDLGALKEQLAIFAAERDWNQFHNPKNLAMALSVEAAELLEIFQWLTADQGSAVENDSERKMAVGEELADIVVYAVRMAGVLNIDLSRAIEEKIAKNAVKYPVHKARGNAKKYSDL